MAIEVLNPIRYCKPVTLDELRRAGLRNPPRSYMFLYTENPVHREVLKLVNEASRC